MNGEAIYGTKPWKATRQWTAGEVPKIDYNTEYATAYDVNSLLPIPLPAKPASKRSSRQKATTATPSCPAGPAASSISKMSTA